MHVSYLESSSLEKNRAEWQLEAMRSVNVTVLSSLVELAK